MPLWREVIRNHHNRFHHRSGADIDVVSHDVREHTLHAFEVDKAAVKLLLLTRLLPLRLSADEKQVHGSSPVNANTGYGTPSLRTLARPLNTAVKISIVTRG